MKLRANQLRQHLERGAPQALYIVSGEEPLIAMESCDAIRKACRDAGFLDREVHQADGAFDWQSLLESANSLSLFGDKKLLEIRQDKPKLDDAAKKAFLDYLQRPNPDTIILLIWPKLEKGFTSTKWFTAVENIAVHIQIWPLEARDMPGWIDARMKARGLQPDRDAVTLLAERVEGNLLAASQEIEKLRLFLDTPQVDGETIRNAVSDHARYDIFSVIDQALEGATAHALKMLHFCKASGEETSVITWAFAKELRQIHKLHTLMGKGLNAQRAMQDCGIWDKRKPLMQKALSRLDITRTESALRQCGAIDRSIKGWSSADPWQGLERLIIALGNKPLPANTIPEQHL